MTLGKIIVPIVIGNVLSALVIAFLFSVFYHANDARDAAAQAGADLRARQAEMNSSSTP